MPKRDASGGFRDVLGVREFRAIWAAEAQSLVGDQIARVALAVLAYDRTGSSAVTGLVYALTFVPALVGGATLSHLADRFRRRELMIGCDVLRAVLLALMALPGLPLSVVCALLVVTVLAGRPFAASQTALLPEILGGDSYVLGSGLRLVSDQVAQLIGFVTGGLVVAAVGVRTCLLLDAATFVVSALLLRLFVLRRPAPNAGEGSEPASRQSLRMTVSLLVGDPRLRLLLGFGLLAGLHVVPEGVAPSYAHAAGAGSVAIGVLMASLPLGTAVGAWLVVRLKPQTRSRLIGPLAIATAIPLIACLAKPGIGVSAGLWVSSGLFAAYQVPASAAFVLAVPDRCRGQMVGLAASAVLAAQGIGVVLFGFVAEHATAADAVGAAGVIALVAAIPLAVGWARHADLDDGRPASYVPSPSDGGLESAGEL